MSIFVLKALFHKNDGISGEIWHFWVEFRQWIPFLLYNKLYNIYLSVMPVRTCSESESCPDEEFDEQTESLLRAFV